jgi:L-ascorbate metabolism protein UlaG (beta-lactamase superfamily)
MDLQYFGGNCVVLSSKDARVVVDDTLQQLGAKSVLKAGDIALFTTQHDQELPATKINIDGPGEFEVANVSITGIPARAHMDEAGSIAATMYKINMGDVNFLFTGHVYPELNDDQLEEIGLIDVMVVPVGGNGYTLDPVGALKLIKEIEPKLVVPTHYDDKSLKYEVPQQTLQQAIHDLGMEPVDTVTKLKLKPSEISDTTQLIVLERS